MPSGRVFMWCSPGPKYARLLQLIQELRGHAGKANDAVVMELVVAAKLQLAALLNLDVDDVLHIAIVRQHDIQNRSDSIVLKREDDEILSR